MVDENASYKGWVEFFDWKLTGVEVKDIVWLVERAHRADQAEEQVVCFVYLADLAGGRPPGYVADLLDELVGGEVVEALD